MNVAATKKLDEPHLQQKKKGKGEREEEAGDEKGTATLSVDEEDEDYLVVVADATSSSSPSSPESKEVSEDREIATEEGSLSISIPHLELQSKASSTTTTVATTTTTSSIITTNNASKKQQCSECHRRMARDGCILSRCLQCCDDLSCQAHKKSKEQALFRLQILEGTTDVQRTAQTIRSSILPKGRFKERAFGYLGDTVTIWNLRQFALEHPKAKEDAIRKSLKRRRDERLLELPTAADKRPRRAI